MAIKFPTFKNLVDRTRSDVRSQLPDSDPTIFGSFIRAITDSLASRAYDLVLLVEQALNQFFPQTATGIYLERWAGYENLERLAAQGSTGKITITGTVGVAIPFNTELTSSNGDIYSVNSGVSISANSFSIASLTLTGTTVTATTSTAHSLASGNTPTISGAVETEYNGAFEVTVLGNNTFQYEIVGTPTTPATGTVLGAIDSATATIESDGSGQAVNLDNGAVLTFSTPITNVDTTATAQFEGILGGTDAETESELRIRTLQSRANPVANFNASAIEKQASSVAGVTRVFIKEITPNVGDVTIYFFRDNDTNPIPSVSELTDVKTAISVIQPATSDTSNIYVLAPVIVATPFTFSAISPDTATMRAAITNSLTAFFDDKAKFETNIIQDQYRAAIIETQDTSTGEFLQSFTLTTPSSDITITTGEIAGVGSVLFT